VPRRAHSIVRPAAPRLAVDAGGADSGDGERSVGPGNGGPGPGLAVACPSSLCASMADTVLDLSVQTVPAGTT
jgi:hypothetical protein